jgi:carboxyl-terminal processing protease
MLGRRILAWKGAFLLLAGAAAVVVAKAQEVTQEQKSEVLAAVSDILTQRAFVPSIEFAKWPTYLEKQRAMLDEAKDVRAFTNAVNRALREFGASHIRLLTPRAAAARGRTTTVGIGVSVVREDDGLTVRSVSENGPAKEAGIEVGDKIVRVNQAPAEGPELLEGEKGTKVELQIKKPSGALQVITVERKEYSTARTDTLTWPGPDTALIRVHTFSNGYNRTAIEKLFREVREREARALILDLRSNGGGATTNLSHLLSLLLPDGTAVGTFVSRRLAQRYGEATGKPPTNPAEIAAWSQNKLRTSKRSVEPFTGKIAVLVNRGSASASEIVAAALRECASAKLVGANTAGAVLASTFATLPHGFSLQYPITDYVSIKGVRLEKAPLEPDARVTDPVTKEKDPVVEKALEVLREGA